MPGRRRGGRSPSSRPSGPSARADGPPTLTISRGAAPFEHSVLVTGGSGFMGSYLVHQLDAVAHALGGRAAVHSATAMVAVPGSAVLAMPHRAATTASRIQAVVVKVGSTGPLSGEKSRGVG